MKDKIEKIVIDSLLEINEELQDKNLVDITSKTKLYGANGALDSIALVSLITDIEEIVSEEFDKDIILADEKAMSQKTSPFRDVASLTSYVEKLLKDI